MFSRRGLAGNHNLRQMDLVFDQVELCLVRVEKAGNLSIGHIDLAIDFLVQQLVERNLLAQVAAHLIQRTTALLQHLGKLLLGVAGLHLG